MEYIFNADYGVDNSKSSLNSFRKISDLLKRSVTKLKVRNMFAFFFTQAVNY